MSSLCSHEVKTPKRPIREAEARDFQRRFSRRAAIGSGLLAPAILAHLVVMGTKSREQIDTLKNLIITKPTQHHSKTPLNARCDDEAENRRVRPGLTINWTDQCACGLPRMVTADVNPDHFIHSPIVLGRARVAQNKRSRI